MRANAWPARVTVLSTTRSTCRFASCRTTSSVTSSKGATVPSSARSIFTRKVGRSNLERGIQLRGTSRRDGHIERLLAAFGVPNGNLVSARRHVGYAEGPIIAHKRVIRILQNDDGATHPFVDLAEYRHRTRFVEHDILRFAFRIPSQ